MSLIVVGTNHKFSPIELRERLYFSKRAREQALLLLKESPILKGIVILSTCNRVELYASAEEPARAIMELEEFVCQFHEIKKEKIAPYLYFYEDKQAIRHLFSVASGLDSLILGETQILGQVKSLFREAREAGFIDKQLEVVFNAAIAYAEKVHEATGFSRDKVCIGSIAIDFIKEKLGSLSGKNILIIGAGKVTELLLKYLQDAKPNIVFVSNRTFDKAKELALRSGQKAARFDELPQLLKVVDVVITATKSPHFIIKNEAIEEVLSYKPRTINYKLLILDLAVPRDVDPAVQEMENVELFNLEDLNFTVQGNLEKKRLEAERIEKLINQEAEKLWQKLTALEPEPALLP